MPRVKKPICTIEVKSTDVIAHIVIIDNTDKETFIHRGDAEAFAFRMAARLQNTYTIILKTDWE